MAIILYYDHESRSIEDKNGNEVSIDKAKKLYLNGIVKDSNMAFITLIKNDFDMEEVEKYYKSFKDKS